MARKHTGTNRTNTRVDTRNARNALPLRREPYWQRLGPGRSIGWRRLTKDSPGNWLARVYRNGKNEAHPLGQLLEVDEDRRYDAALAAATQWFTSLEDGNVLAEGAPTRVTLLQALQEHEKAFRGTTKGERKADQTMQAFSLLVMPYDPQRKDGSAQVATPDGKGGTTYTFTEDSWTTLPIAQITTAMFTQWLQWVKGLPTQPRAKEGRKDKGKARSPDTVQRNLTTLRAALNRAKRVHKVPDNWTEAFSRRGQQPEPRAAKDFDPQATYLTREERALIVAQCKDLQPLVQAMLTVPVRPGALAEMGAANYLPARGKGQRHALQVGWDKGHEPRKVTLPDTAQVRALFTAATKDKLPGAPLFRQSNGKAWDANAWNRKFKEACKAAGLDPRLSIYSLRHSLITDMVPVPGASPLLIANIAGTSVKMIEEHYYHLQHDTVSEVLQAVGF